MNSLRRHTRSTFARAMSNQHMPPPTRSFVVSKVVPAAAGALVFGTGYMMGSLKIGSELFLHGKLPTLAPARHSVIPASVDNEIGPEPGEYGAQLVQRVTKEMTEARCFFEEDPKLLSTERRLEYRRRYDRIRRLWMAVWAIHMLEFADCTEVVELLEKNAREIVRRSDFIKISLLMAQEARIAGNTRDLEAYIKKVIETNQKNLPSRPAK